eukprot:TRINITY_DN34394_c0_g1_i1.p1 TRINITY_DN34394_c0_g1~~TRINITY_DN34394_c0_g1_i1.p1  ORF type:complete len:330 (-),score=40.94 TRINITY_DN34394_c0_g1_i1:28-945(-)
MGSVDGTSGSFALASREILAGSLGGAASSVVGHPLDVVKTRLQAQTSSFRSLSTMECLRSTVRAEGTLGLWRGLGAPIVGAVVYQATVFTSFERILAHVRRADLTENKARLLSGCASGVVTSFVLTPFDAVKIELQLQRETAASANILKQAYNATRHIITTKGPLTLFGGLSACMVRDVPSSAVYLGSYYKLKEVIAAKLGQNRDTQSAGGWKSCVSQTVAGGLAGVFSWTVACPMDNVKTIQQEASLRGQRIGFCDAVSGVYQREGLRGFSRGIVPLVLKAFPSNAICFLVYERAKYLLGLLSS